MKIILTFLLGLCLSVGSFAKVSSTEFIKKTIMEKFQFKEVVVGKTDFAGLYEVGTEEGMFYVDDKVNFLISGQLYDVKQDTRVFSGYYVSRALGLTFDKLPMQYAIKRVHGKGERTIVVFEDPFCTYCRKLDHDLAKVDNVTIYTFLLALWPKSYDQVNRLWCANNSSKAWEDFMIRGIEPKGVKSNCQYPFEEVKKLASLLGIRSTPNMIFPNGRRIAGYVPVSEIEKHWK